MAQFLAFLFAYALSQFFRSFLAVIAPELQAELGIDATGLATLSMAWFLAFALAQFAVGAALDGLGRAGRCRLSCWSRSLARSFSRHRQASPGVVGMALIGVGSAAIYMGAVYTFARTASTRAVRAALFLAAGNRQPRQSGWRRPRSLMRPRPRVAATFVAIAALTLLSAVSFWWWSATHPRPRRRQENRLLLERLGAIAGIRRSGRSSRSSSSATPSCSPSADFGSAPIFRRCTVSAPTERGNAILAMAAAMSLGALPMVRPTACSGRANGWWWWEQP